MTNKNIVEIPINDYDDFVTTIRGKNPKYPIDFREQFIFRGVSNKNYRLEPHSVRKNKLNQLEINDYIESDYKFWIDLDKDYATKNNLNFNNKFHDKNLNTVPVEVDKYGELVLEEDPKCELPRNILQIKRELYVLIKFLKIADKSGLKIDDNYETRSLIHNLLKYTPKQYWPEKKFMNIISLAQHYSIPTRAMDWSYDYKVALYFSIKSILKGSHADGAVWALNYKLFEDNYIESEYLDYKLQFYRPEYYVNPNLNAQNGLFTFLIENKEKLSHKEFHDILIEALHDEEKNIDHIEPGKRLILIPDGIKKEDILFYKFIIPKEEKANMLKELYLEDYSEECLFPGYKNVEMNMQNRVILDDMINKRNKSSENNLIISMNENKLDKIKNEEKKCEFIKNIPESINQIFILVNGEIKAYFKGNQIIKSTLDNLWKFYGKYSNISRDEFDEYFKNEETGLVIMINDFKELKYPIKINVEPTPHLIKKDDNQVNFLLNFR